jgi:hypothetical protein
MAIGWDKVVVDNYHIQVKGGLREMKIFKKISAIVSSALLVGMTMGVAAAAAYPSPFVAGGSGDVAIVYGTGAGMAVTDVVEANALNLNLNSYVTGTSGSSSVGGSGGDLKVLSTSARSLYYGDPINAAYASALTNSELPTMLAPGTFSDASGNNYAYTQTVKLGVPTLAFGTSSGNFGDPKLYINADYGNATVYYWNYTLSLSKNLNVSDTTNVVGQTITIMGQPFVIGTSSTNNTLYLNGAGQDQQINGGDTATVTVNGVQHSVKTVTTSDASHGTLLVDGISRDVVEGSTYSFPGNFNIYVKSVVHPAFAGDTRYIEILAGSSSLKLVDGQTVKKGSDTTAIQGTLANINAVGNGLISGFTLQVTANSSLRSYILPGTGYTDPVFGAAKLSLVDVVPDLSSTARAKVEFSSDGGSNPQFLYLTLTSSRAGTEKKIPIVFDNNTATTAIQPLLAHLNPSTNGRGVIHVLESENARLNDWIVVNSGDAGTILQVDDMSTGNGNVGYVSLSDALTGQSYGQISLTNTSSLYASTSTTINGGTGYVIEMNQAGNWTNITWNSATTALFPRIKLASGGWIALLQDTTFANATNLLLPNAKTTIDTGAQTVYGNPTSDTAYVDDGVAWIDTNATATPLGNMTALYGHIWGVNTSSGSWCNFNVTKGPALLLFEPKKYSDSSYGTFVCIPEGGSTTAMAITDEQFNSSASSVITLTSDVYQKQAVDQYGTFVVEETPANTNGDVTMWIPNTQMYFDVAMASQGTTITPGVSGGGGVSLGSVIVADTGISGVQQHNLIVVGGSCINAVAANLVGGTYCGADWTSKTSVGSGQFLIQSFGNAYTSGKIALLVAGYDATDTVNAATYLMNKFPDTSAGKKWVGTDASTATLQVASS